MSCRWFQNIFDGFRTLSIRLDDYSGPGWLIALGRCPRRALPAAFGPWNIWNARPRCWGLCNPSGVSPQSVIAKKSYTHQMLIDGRCVREGERERERETKKEHEKDTKRKRYKEKKRQREKEKKIHRKTYEKINTYKDKNKKEQRKTRKRKKRENENKIKQIQTNNRPWIL